MATHLPHVHLKAKDRRALDRQRDQRPEPATDRAEWREYTEPLSSDLSAWKAALRHSVKEE